MAKSLYNITFVRGDTAKITFTLKDENKAAIDLTGYSLAVTVRKTAITDTAILTFSSATPPSPFTTTSASSGIITLNISPSDTSSLAAGTYVYDLQITSGSGVVTTPVCNEKFIIEQDVTY